MLKAMICSGNAKQVDGVTLVCGGECSKIGITKPEV